MWGMILSFLGGPIVNGLISAYKAKLDAANSTGRQAADVAQAAMIAEVQARASKDVLVATQFGRWYTALPMVATMGAAAAFFVKTVVWDTMLGWGETPALHGDVQVTYNLIMSFWFGGVAVKGAIVAARTWWR